MTYQHTASGLSMKLVLFITLHSIYLARNGALHGGATSVTVEQLSAVLH